MALSERLKFLLHAALGTRDERDELVSKMVLADGSVAFTAAISHGSHLINSVSDPVSAQDAATKNYVDNKVLTFTSSAGAGGSATEAMVLTGLASTDTILAVSQMTKGANNLPLLGFSTLATNALTGIWSANPGAGAVIVVTVKR